MQADALTSEPPGKPAYTYTYMFLFRFSSFIVYYKILSIVPCAIQYVLVGYSMNIIIISITGILILFEVLEQKYARRKCDKANIPN